ncbi:MAG: response regulator [Gammaproteobacteria bacterium]|jgi:DNA-binding NarL/FixJ family response regulator|nr:response regulator [Gammaproteobacteria bacterium]MBT4605658.1 response regulator [Thiotrichales bacterium]MBT3473450.1 response regulator [Gammaproteobacteria bacterium]MBT3968072.1 response regulator [Gammaproteobacteria bacterium]MBT4079897.1 response regulator [Gammaproteobacteria bacterium]
MKALIVDDDPILRDILRKMVVSEGIDDVSEASSGGQGIDLWRSQSPNIIFLDVQLPDMSGLDILKKIREQDQRVYIVVVTGHVSVNTVQEIVKFKADQYIVKPLDQGRIHQAIQSGKRRI